MSIGLLSGVKAGCVHLCRQVTVKKVKEHIAVNGFPTQLRDVTRHMGSYSITCYPTQVNAPRLNPSWYSIYLPRRDGRLS